MGLKVRFVTKKGPLRGDRVQRCQDDNVWMVEMVLIRRAEVARFRDMKKMFRWSNTAEAHGG
jgi:hypothetical protein